MVAARGKTAVAVVTREFEGLSHTMAANAGRAGLRIQVLPYPLETLSEAQVREIACTDWDSLVETLGAR